MGIHDREYYRDDEPGFRLQSPKSMVMMLIIINVVIFVLDAFSGDDNFGGKQLSSFMAIKTDLVEKPWNFYQIVTNAFAHAPITSQTGFMHILGNMLALFFLGQAVEQRYGSGEFIRIYMSAVVIASVAWLASHLIQGGPASAYGASGAVSAVVILFVLNFPNQTLLIWGVLPIRAWILGVILIGMDFLRAFNPESRIAYEAHLAGAAFAAMYFYGKWNLSWMDAQWIRNLGSRFKNATKGRQLKIHRPEEADPKLQEEADRILEKISSEGQESLTKKEQKTLEKYSKLMRKKQSR